MGLRKHRDNSSRLNVTLIRWLIVAISIVVEELKGRLSQDDNEKIVDQFSIALRAEKIYSA